MGRRLNTIRIVTALAVGLGAGLAPRASSARQDPSPPSAPAPTPDTDPFPVNGPDPTLPPADNSDGKSDPGSPPSPTPLADPAPLPGPTETPQTPGKADPKAGEPDSKASDPPSPTPVAAPPEFEATPTPTPTPTGKPKAEAASPDLPPPASLDEPSPPAPSAPAGPVDDKLRRVKGADPTEKDKGPLPPAAEGPEADAAAVTDPERLPIGPHTYGLTVNVISPQAINLNKSAALKIVVKNPGPTEALGVVVRDVLPPGLTYESSQPEAKRAGSTLTWSLGAVPAGAERTVLLNVTPTRVGSFDHAATVTMTAGGRSTTMVHEPKLRVEQTATSGKVLKGQQVQFKIAVTNPGDGPARNVTVQAKLSPGLQHESEAGGTNEQNLFEQTLDVIGPGDRVELDTLVANTVLGGEQSCVVVVKSPDVVKTAESKSVKSVTIVEPMIKLAMSGPDKRYTDTTTQYEIKVKNPGTAATRNVKVSVTLPSGARYVKSTPEARYDETNRRLAWSRPQLEPGEEATLTYHVRLGGPSLYTFAAEAKGDGAGYDKNTMTTDVLGLAILQLNVSEAQHVVDVGEHGVLKIVIKNTGSKAATRISVSAKLDDTVVPKMIGGVETPGKLDPAQGLCIFPSIDRLEPGKQIELGIKFDAMKPGVGKCHVYLTHDDPTEEKLEDIAVFKVTKAGP